MSDPNEDVEPELVESPLSRAVFVDGWWFEISVYRLEGDEKWTVEVLDEALTSHSWEDYDRSDERTFEFALDALREEGGSGFLRAEDRWRFVNESPELARQFERAAISMPLGEALGMMAALVSTPTLSSAAAWTRAIMDTGSFASREHVQEFADHLTTTYNEIVARLRSGDGAVPPSRALADVRDWCRGYVECARQDPVWLDDVEAMKFLEPFEQLAAPVAEGASSSVRAEATEVLRREFVPWIHEEMAEIHEYWEDARRADLELLTAERDEDDGVYRREQPKVGRNQPCPCGSGKKYKRCCGAN